MILDVLADMFSGDENSRPQARQFIGLLKRLARKHECAFILLAHPSLTGMNTGTGTSGSTGWSNAVRSRLYFQVAKASDGSVPNKNLRTLEGMKSNYSELPKTITVEWKNGLFVPVDGPQGLDKIAANARAEEVFMTILRKYNAQNRNARECKGTAYAPALFADEPDALGVNKKQLEAAMGRLVNDKKICIEESGPPSGGRARWPQPTATRFNRLEQEYDPERSNNLRTRFRVGCRFTCIMSIGCDGGALKCEWQPKIPTRLSKQEMADYRRGRNALVAELARLTNQKSLSWNKQVQPSTIFNQPSHHSPHTPHGG